MAMTNSVFFLVFQINYNNNITSKFIAQELREKLQ